MWRGLRGHRDVTLLLGASLVSQTGDWVLGVGLAFEVFALTGSTLASAAVMLATQVPLAVLGSVAGVVVDRGDRRRIMIGANLASAALVWPLVLVRGAGDAWIIVMVVALTSVVSPFFVAAEASLLPSLVPDQAGLIRVNALNAQVRNGARLIGAALGGVVVGIGGLGGLAAADAVSFVAAAALLLAIRHRSPAADRADRLHLIDDWREGVAVIRRSRVLLVVVAFFVLTGVGEGTMGTLFAPFVDDVLGGTVGLYGAILSAQAVGGIVGGLVITILGPRIRPRALFTWGALAFGLLDLALFLYPLLDPAAWPAFALIAIVGLPGAAVTAGVLTLFQSATSDRDRGRVFGSLTSLQNAAMLLSTAAAGALATPLGIIPVICTQGAVYVVVAGVALVGLRSRA
ncbi:MFS transporter [Frondihabitans australicus]|uniref:Na+/melibiose symporter-like transporter n=1 Tax=Frondihabitans australicus TaxID=386892 RepID=A0A495IBI8_9MICO|nr:MFS transporter [Frondihabitans australicus]RKR73364.1 Na+/melibiose symporter-like transporter [Frondihabitans australicus]